VLIPTFAVERAQELLYILREFKESGDIPASTPVFLDSPLAIDATRIFRAHPECYDREAREVLQDKHRRLFQFPGLHFTRSVAASREINHIQGGAIILAGSGMCTGGRIKHHLKHNLWREEASVVFVGFQARGTLGRRIVEGAEEVEIYGEVVRVRAQIWTINGFSAHADRTGLRSWLGRFHGQPRVLLVHGEEQAQDAFRKQLVGEGYRVETPEYRETLVF